jgi:hypothetical protein
LNRHTLEVTLNTTKTSDGTKTTTPDGPIFKINSFFNVFVGIWRDGIPLSATHQHPILLVAVPKPSAWTMLLVGFGGFGLAACRLVRLTDFIA